MFRPVFFLLLAALFLIGAPVCAQQVGVHTHRPDPSAALHVDHARKGLLPPRVQLDGNRDVTTVPSPARGLIVYNLEARRTGTPRAVDANTFYFWNGTEWCEVANVDLVESLLYPQVFFMAVDGWSNQQYLSGLRNLGDVEEIRFVPDPDELNIGANITLQGNHFQVNRQGAYEVAGLFTACPEIELSQSCTLHFIVQRKPAGSSGWADLARSITTWGNNLGRNSLTTAIAPLVFRLEHGDRLRLVAKLVDGHISTFPGKTASIRPATGMGKFKLIRITKLD